LAVIRLHVAGELAAGAIVRLSEGQAHYLLRVMRLSTGDEVLAFNGRDGEWRSRLAAAGKRGGTLQALAQTRPQSVGAALDLVVALVKRARLETIVEKAAELGARQVRLLITERTNAERANVERLGAIAAEAAEQTGRLDVPVVLPPQKLGALLADWPADRRLMFCDEAGEAPPVLTALGGLPAGAWGILIGPEGGFSPDERTAIRAAPTVVPVSLGPRILRADTAAISALTLWQAALGDLRGA
jgi:16S rRNA (uracil1498-N3)-methyltransferase